MDRPASIAARLLSCLDLTSLGEQDDRARIAALCRSAGTPYGAPAAVCVYPEWIVFARDRLYEAGLPRVAVATVANFPEGAGDAARVEGEVQRAVAAGADEVDVVFPWRAFLCDDTGCARAVLRAARRAAGDRVLKVILETGELAAPPRIRAAAAMAMAEGADFLKTSTGKRPVGATLEAAAVLLAAIQEHGGPVGFKAAGGIRGVVEAAAYLALADRMLGPGWAVPARFRIGASVLLDGLCAVLSEPA